MLLEERIRENKINVLNNNNNNNNSSNNNRGNNNNNVASVSVPEAGETVNSKFKLKNIIQAKVEFNFALLSVMMTIAVAVVR